VKNPGRHFALEASGSGETSLAAPWAEAVREQVGPGGCGVLATLWRCGFGSGPSAGREDGGGTASEAAFLAEPPLGLPCF